MIPLARQRAAALLLEELKTGADQWFVISMVHVPTKKFVGAAFIPGKGPTDAWMRFHGLNLGQENCETATQGPLPADKVELMPKELLYRLLNEAELKSSPLGQG